MKPVKAKIYWVQVCSYPSCDRIEAHAHEFFHYIYVIHGTGSIQIGEHSYAMTPKHMYLVAPGKLHAFQNTGQERLVTCELKFDFFDVRMSGKAAKLAECTDVSDTPILGILQNIRREHAAGRDGCAEIIAMNLQEILIHLRRSCRFPEPQQETAEGDLITVIEYIENNLDCDINLQDLANIVCLEKTYFLKKFKQLTGTTPMAYTRKERIRKAKELLKYSDMSVTQIARAVGFQSVHHFSRNFAAVTGMSPSKYKQEHPIH